ncbi:MAG: diguanylate cyclase [Halieaceae bacterium]|jgi:diguanylate cyclase (GGDEF)-like protein|nr:diguanylate cyclase [Halieaceae bacterium]
MKQEPLCTRKDHPQLAELARIVGSSRYFNRLSPDILTTILRQGNLLTVEKDQYLIREGDESPPEMYVLVEGSLAIVSNGKFILRLDSPGDVVGEMAVIQSAPRSADVITESVCRLVGFPAELFMIDGHSSQASILYVLFSHMMAAKLRITTAQSLIRKNQRVTAHGDIKVGIINAGSADSAIIREAIRESWPETSVVEFSDPPEFLDYPGVYRFDLIIADMDYFDDFQRDWNPISSLVKTMGLRGASVITLGTSCKEAANRKFLLGLGVDEVLAKPCTAFDLAHTIARARVWYYKDLELDKAENAAETDRLTGLANRRRLDQFLDALVTVYPDNLQPFSLVIADVDNFKHYNDTQGHQMGDVVLEGIATLLATNVRRGDLAARFGGEEFVIVLPNCEKHRAIELAEDLRKSVESAVFPHQDLQPTGNITITMGVATFPEDAVDLKSLLKQADDCLYEGKRAGKNVVIAAGGQ